MHLYGWNPWLLMKSTFLYMSLTRSQEGLWVLKQLKSAQFSKLTASRCPENTTGTQLVLFQPRAWVALFLQVWSFPHSPLYGHKFLGCITPNKQAPKGFVLLFCCVLLTACFIQLMHTGGAGSNSSITPLRLFPSCQHPGPSTLLLQPHADVKRRRKPQSRIAGHSG